MSDRRRRNLGPQDIIERRKSPPRRRELSRALGEAVLKYETERASREELERRNAVLETEKYTDSLTGLANHRAFSEKFPELVNIAQNSGEPLALLFVDSVDLHNLNREKGKVAGDNLLKTIAADLKSIARQTDMVARIGGDEFVVALTGFKPITGTNESELIKDTLAKYEMALESRATLGIATLDSNETAEELLSRADAACTMNKPFANRSVAEISS